MNVVKIPSILLPKKNIDLTKWSVVACDQFTSQNKYWTKLSSVCDGYSALNLILPEIYLNDNRDMRLKHIRENMEKYIKDGIFDTIENSFILVERTTKSGLIRVGIMLAVDLDAYDFFPMNRNYIKATEATVSDRLPVRVDIRDNAIIELPHIMLLIDDRENTVIEPLYANRATLEPLYDFELNMDGGHLRGYKIANPEAIIEKMYKLIDKDLLISKYGSDNPFLFAVGDGNHSLAAAKKCWDGHKTSMTAAERESSPLRYALCELVNLHCDGLNFEPIHRVVFGAGDSFISEMQSALTGNNSLRISYNGNEYSAMVNENSSKAIGEITEFIDGYLAKHKEAEIDYIHGEAHLLSVAKDKNGVAIFMPKLQKNELFSYVIEKGILPRKAFSMGEAEEKRYYTEARIIK